MERFLQQRMNESLKWCLFSPRNQTKFLVALELALCFLQRLSLTGSKGFFFCSNLRFGERQSTVTMVFTRWPREVPRQVPSFSNIRRKMSAFKRFLPYFATGCDTASCQDYEEYEFVECLSEET